MEILFVLALSWLVTVKTGGQAARDWQLARKGQLPPEAQARIKAMETAGQLAAKGMSPEEAFRAMRKQPGAFGAYWRRMKDDKFDKMHANHVARDAKQREKRRQKAEGTYTPGAFETFAFDVKDGLWRRWDRAWDKATDRREAKRQETDPAAGSGTDSDRERQPGPLPNNSNPDTATEPEVSTSGSDRSAGDPDSAGPLDTRPEPEQALDDPKGTDVDPEVEQAAARPIPGPDRKPNPEPAADADRGDTTNLDPGHDPESESTPDSGTEVDTTTETEEPMADGMTPSGGQGSGSGGEINSQRKMALAEQRIAELMDSLMSKAQRIADSAQVNQLATAQIHQGIEVLGNARTSWSSAGSEHERAAAAATEVVASHQQNISYDLDYDVRDQ